MMRIITRKDVPEYERPSYENSKYLITLELQDVATITDAKTGAFVIEKKPVEISKVDAQEYIDSFKDDVGIINLLKKFALTEDPSIFNQRTRVTVPVGEDGKEEIQDYSNLPRTEEDAIKVVEKAKTLFSQLPPDLVNNRSFMEFAETCTQEELVGYINTLKNKGDNKNE